MKKETKHKLNALKSQLSSLTNVKLSKKASEQKIAELKEEIKKIENEHNYTTKPGFIRNRLLQLFASDDIIEQQRIVDTYNKIRNKECYCGHTDKCDCGNPGIYEFKSSLMSNSISEDILDKVLENKAHVYRSPTVQRILDKMENDPWHVKLKRWWRLKVWVYTCLTRKYWDKSFEGYIFKSKKQ